jgi:hypothetical protein
MHRLKLTLLPRLKTKIMMVVKAPIDSAHHRMRAITVNEHLPLESLGAYMKAANVGNVTSHDL